jgi:beta-glucosidase-like glycosyl hydrolase
MEPRRDIARLVVTSYSARRAGEEERLLREVGDDGVGGYCVFGGSVDSVGALNERIAREAGRPLVVASDLERGLGQQLAGGTVFPSQMALGATGAPVLARDQSRVTAVEARAAGINLIFAPVADVASEPANPIVGVRSYGSDPATAAAFTRAFVEGCRAGGAAPTAKHFPGHGATLVDSHIDLPEVAAGRDLLDRRELPPFRAAIGAGVPAIMAGHIAFPAITGSDVPASLSPAIVDGLLRGDLGFGGVVVTDALMMGAVTRRFDPAEAAVRALEAGADLLLMPADVTEAIDGVAAAIESGRLPPGRIERSVERVDRLLAWIERAAWEADRVEDRAAARDAGRLALEIARRAVTLVRERPGATPTGEALAGGGTALLAFVDAERPPDLAPLFGALGEVAPGNPLAVLHEKVADAEVETAVALARDRAFTIAFVFDEPAAWRGRPGPTDALVALVRRVLAAARESAVVAFTTPALEPLLPEAGSFFACYDGSPPMQLAAVDFIRKAA